MSKRVAGEGFIRWYDQDPDVSRFVYGLEKEDPSLWPVFCTLLCTYADGLKEEQKRKGARSVGGDKHIGLLKSQQKTRWFDQHPHTYRAFNHLYLMNDPERKEICQRLAEPLTALTVYKAACQRVSLQPIQADMEALVRVAYNEGTAGWRRFLSDIGLVQTHTAPAYEIKYQS